jgi:hypothetical protein
MTAISAPRAVAGATPFERSLLRAAQTLDAYVASRLARRSSVAYRSAASAQSRALAARNSAEAHRSAGMLPR